MNRRIIGDFVSGLRARLREILINRKQRPIYPKAIVRADEKLLARVTVNILCRHRLTTAQMYFKRFTSVIAIRGPYVHSERSYEHWLGVLSRPFLFNQPRVPPGVHGDRIEKLFSTIFRTIRDRLKMLHPYSNAFHPSISMIVAQSAVGSG